MKLSLAQIKEITLGAVDVKEIDGKIHFYRFSEKQSLAYKNVGAEDSYQKTFATAGVRLSMRTDTRHICFDYSFESGSSREFGWFDVYENGALVQHFGGEGATFSARANIPLSDGEKEVEIYFPWSVATMISDFSVDDGSFVVPKRPAAKMICFGDSITHGYDTMYPSLSYASQISDALGLEHFNLGIGGETFFPDLIDDAYGVDPEIITVAYGTNDWTCMTQERFKDVCKAFYKKLSEIYPNSKIFAIAPIWRNDYLDKTDFAAPANAVYGVMKEVCSEFSNVTVLDGWKFTPHIEEFYSDRCVHPTDLGFCFYAKNLTNAIKLYLNT